MSYAAVHARPEGESTVARVALNAAEQGYDGVVVRNHDGEQPTYDAEAVAVEHDVDVVRGLEVHADDPSRAHGIVEHHRDRIAVLAVHGGTDRMNRFAVERPAVDVLAHPTRNDTAIDETLVKTAVANGVAVEFDLGPICRSAGGKRVRHVQALSTLWDLVDHHDAPYVVSVDARSHLQLRSPRDLAAVGGAIGLPPAAVRHGLETWGDLAERNRERLSDAFVEPGVRRLGDE